MNENNIINNTSTSLNGEVDLHKYYDIIYSKWVNNEYTNDYNPTIDFKGFHIKPYFKYVRNRFPFMCVFRRFLDTEIELNGGKYTLDHDNKTLVKLNEDDKLSDHNLALVRYVRFFMVRGVDKFDCSQFDSIIPKIKNEIFPILSTMNCKNMDLFLTQLTEFLEGVTEKCTIKDKPKPNVEVNPEKPKDDICILIDKYNRIVDSLSIKGYCCYLGDDTVVRFTDVEIEKYMKYVVAFNDLNDILYIIMEKEGYLVDKLKKDIYSVLVHLQMSIVDYFLTARDYILNKNPKLQKDLATIINRYTLAYKYIVERDILDEDMLELITKRHKEVINIIKIREDIKVKREELLRVIREKIVNFKNDIDAISNEIMHLEYLSLEASFQYQKRLKSIKQDIVHSLSEYYYSLPMSISADIESLVLNIDSILDRLKISDDHVTREKVKKEREKETKNEIVKLLTDLVENKDEVVEILDKKYATAGKYYSIARITPLEYTNIDSAKENLDYINHIGLIYNNPNDGIWDVIGLARNVYSRSIYDYYNKGGNK